MYVSMKDILTHADKHNYAVMAVNRGIRILWLNLHRMSLSFA